jgi:hydrogenase expression/formation protein HypE
VIEEGFDMVELKKIVASMADEAVKAGIRIVCGDTKVVDKGKCDKVFITTSGIGLFQPANEHISTGLAIVPGDKIILNGAVGNHGMAVMSARKGLSLSSGILSDCASLNGLIEEILNGSNQIKFMRDATRGGLSTVLAELVQGRDFGINVLESAIPVDENVQAICELLGFDPFYVANEGKVVVVAGNEDAGKVLEIMKTNPAGIDAAIIGEITGHRNGKVVMKTVIGGERYLDMLSTEQLPRIC